MIDKPKDLKPCPFCGGDVVALHWPRWAGGASQDGCAWFVCGGCDATGPHVWDTSKVAEAWNKRDTQPRRKG